MGAGQRLNFGVKLSVHWACHFAHGFALESEADRVMNNAVENRVSEGRVLDL